MNKIAIALMQITPKDERYYGICASSEFLYISVSLTYFHYFRTYLLKVHES